MIINNEWGIAAADLVYDNWISEQEILEVQDWKINIVINTEKSFS
jgi:hypothetical protein